MYMSDPHPVHMIEVTATDLRKDLFRILDRMAETGEVLRVMRRGRAMDLIPQTQEKAVAEMTPEERFDRWMAKGVRKGSEDWDFDHTDNSHWTWDPDTKFKDLLEP